MPGVFEMGFLVPHERLDTARAAAARLLANAAQVPLRGDDELVRGDAVGQDMLAANVVTAKKIMRTDL